MNIITIVSDTLRYDCVAFHGRKPFEWDLARAVETPHIDAFAREAFVFDRAYTGSFPTLPMRTSGPSRSIGATSTSLPSRRCTGSTTRTTYTSSPLRP